MKKKIFLTLLASSILGTASTQVKAEDLTDNLGPKASGINISNLMSPNSSILNNNRSSQSSDFDINRMSYDEYEALSNKINSIRYKGQDVDYTWTQDGTLFIYKHETTNLIKDTFANLGKPMPEIKEIRYVGEMTKTSQYVPNFNGLVDLERIYGLMNFYNKDNDVKDISSLFYNTNSLYELYLPPIHASGDLVMNHFLTHAEKLITFEVAEYDVKGKLVGESAFENTLNLERFVIRKQTTPIKIENKYDVSAMFKKMGFLASDLGTEFIGIDKSLPNVLTMSTNEDDFTHKNGESPIRIALSPFFEMKTPVLDLSGFDMSESNNFNELFEGVMTSAIKTGDNKFPKVKTAFSMFANVHNPEVANAGKDYTTRIPVPVQIDDSVIKPSEYKEGLYSAKDMFNQSQAVVPNFTEYHITELNGIANVSHLYFRAYYPPENVVVKVHSKNSTDVIGNFLMGDSFLYDGTEHDLRLKIDLSDAKVNEIQVESAYNPYGNVNVKDFSIIGKANIATGLLSYKPIYQMLNGNHVPFNRINEINAPDVLSIYGGKLPLELYGRKGFQIDNMEAENGENTKINVSPTIAKKPLSEYKDGNTFRINSSKLEFTNGKIFVNDLLRVEDNKQVLTSGIYGSTFKGDLDLELYTGNYDVDMPIGLFPKSYIDDYTKEHIRIKSEKDTKIKSLNMNSDWFSDKAPNGKTYDIDLSEIALDENTSSLKLEGINDMTWGLKNLKLPKITSATHVNEVFFGGLVSPKTTEDGPVQSKIFIDWNGAKSLNVDKFNYSFTFALAPKSPPIIDFSQYGSIKRIEYINPFDPNRTESGNVNFDVNGLEDYDYTVIPFGHLTNFQGPTTSAIVGDTFTLPKAKLFNAQSTGVDNDYGWLSNKGEFIKNKNFSIQYLEGDDNSVGVAEDNRTWTYTKDPTEPNTELYVSSDQVVKLKVGERTPTQVKILGAKKGQKLNYSIRQNNPSDNYDLFYETTDGSQAFQLTSGNEYNFVLNSIGTVDEINYLVEPKLKSGKIDTTKSESINVEYSVSMALK